MISLEAACSICLGKKIGYKVKIILDYGDVWKITVAPKEEPCDPFMVLPFLVRKSDGAVCGFFPPAHEDDYPPEKGQKLEIPEKYR